MHRSPCLMYIKVPKMLAKGKKTQEISQDEDDLMCRHQVLACYLSHRSVQSVQNVGSRGRKSFLLLSLGISVLLVPSATPLRDSTSCTTSVFVTLSLPLAGTLCQTLITDASPVYSPGMLRHSFFRDQSPPLGLC